MAETNAAVETAEILAYVVKREDGIHVIDNDGTEGPVCTRKTVDGYYYLTPNAANRKFINVAKADAMQVGEQVGLTYKGTRHIGSGGSSKVPNGKLLEKWLPEEFKEEYEALIARAREAMEADRATNKKQPMTDVEKAQAKAKKALEALAAAGVDIDAYLASLKGE